MGQLLRHAQHPLAFVLFGIGIGVGTYGPTLLGISKIEASLIAAPFFVSGIIVEIAVSILASCAERKQRRVERKQKQHEEQRLLGLLKSDLSVYREQKEQNYEIRSHKVSLPDIMRAFSPKICVNLNHLRDCIERYNNVHKAVKENDKEKRKDLKKKIEKCIEVLEGRVVYELTKRGMKLPEIEDLSKMMMRHETELSSLQNNREKDS